MIKDDELATEDRDIIEEAKERRANCIAHNSENIKAAKDDLNVLEGGEKAWDPQEVHSRTLRGLPIIAFNFCSF